MKTLTQDELEALAAKVGALLVANGQKFASAESCTGGWLAQCVTALPGSSDWFERGYVTYSNAAKEEMLGVPAAVLQAHGAVSEPVASAMATGALAKSHADWALAITGVAGPSGGSPEKPVGSVCFAWIGLEATVEVASVHFAGDRREVRAQSVAFALEGLLRRAAALSA